MKCLVVLLPLLALAACSPQSLVTAWHWRDFTAHPNAGRYASLADDLSGCHPPTCPAMSGVSDAMIDDLGANISPRNLIAVRAGMRVYPLVKPRGLVAVRLARQLSVVADESASIYLSAATAERFDDDAVSAIPAGMDGNDWDETNLLTSRRAKLAAVTSPTLRVARDKALAILDAKLEPLQNAMERLPRPVP